MNIKKNRIFGLDVLRAIAIIIVVMSHGDYMLNETFLDGFPYLKVIDGVDIFFVLSGFLIGGILLRDLSSKKTFKIADLFHFWKRRWFRTLPNYYLILLLNILFVYFGIIKEDINQFSYHFLVFTQNFKTPFYDFFWESWSLSIEEWFYILTPIIIFFLRKLTSVKFSFLIATILMITFPVVFRASILDPEIDRFWYDVTFRKTVLSRLDSIGYGLLSAWFYFYYLSYWKKIKIPSFLLGLGLIYFLLNYPKDISSFYGQVTYFSILPFAVMLLLPLAEAYKKATGILPYAIEHISKISYSMYLINLALVAEVIRDNFPPTGGWDGISKYLIYWAIVIFVSTLLYKYFEKPIMDLRDKKF